MQNLRTADENDGPIYAVCRPKFTKFWHHIGNPCTLQRPCPIVYVVFHPKDIRH